MICTTLKAIKEYGPCSEGWKKLLRHLGKTKCDEEPLPLVEILKSNGLDDAIWCLRSVDHKSVRLYAVACAREVQHLMADARSLEALDVAGAYANGQATEEEMQQARNAACEAAYVAKEAHYAACDAANAAYAAANAACDATCDAAKVAAKVAAYYAAKAAAYYAACDAAYCATNAAYYAAYYAAYDATNAAYYAAYYATDAAYYAPYCATNAAPCDAARERQVELFIQFFGE